MAVQRQYDETGYGAITRRAGRWPTKYTPARVEIIIDALKMCATREAASAAAGIHNWTLIDWLHKYPKFAKQVIEAEQIANQKAIDCVRAAFTGITKTTTVSTYELRGGVKVLVEEKVTTSIDVDPRIALEYLKRRDRVNWTDKLPEELAAPAGNFREGVQQGFTLATLADLLEDVVNDVVRNRNTIDAVALDPTPESADSEPPVETESR